MGKRRGMREEKREGEGKCRGKRQRERMRMRINEYILKHSRPNSLS